MSTHFEKAIKRDLETLLQALLSPSFKFRNVSAFAESFDPILKSSDHYALYLKKLIQASVFYFYLLMILRVTPNIQITVIYPFNHLSLNDSQISVLKEVFEKFRTALFEKQPVHDVLLKELTEMYEKLVYMKDVKDLEFNINAVWDYLLEIGTQSTSIDISALYKQKLEAESRNESKALAEKKVTNFVITEDMLEAEP